MPDAVKTNNVIPSILTGARLIIKIDGKIVALATEVSWRQEISVIPIDIMGAMETVAYEPNGYKCSGSLSILRYVSPVVKANKLTTGGADASSNSIDGSVEKLVSENQAQGGSGESNSALDLKNTNVPSHFNPGSIGLSSTCQMIVYEQKDSNTANVVQVARFDEVRFVSSETRPNGTKGEVKEVLNFVCVLVHAGLNKLVQDTRAIVAG